MADRDTPTAVTVRLLRACRGWSQGEFARRAGVDPAALSRYEAGEVRPLRETLRRLATAAEIPLEEVERFADGALAARALRPFDSTTPQSPADHLTRIVERIGAAAIRDVVALRHDRAAGGEERLAS